MGRPALSPSVTARSPSPLSVPSPAAPAACRYLEDAADPRPTRSFGELDDLIRHAPPPTSDDVSITMDGRRLDTKEKVLAFLAEIDRYRRPLRRRHRRDTRPARRRKRAYHAARPALGDVPRTKPVLDLSNSAGGVAWVTLDPRGVHVPVKGSAGGDRSTRPYPG